MRDKIKRLKLYKSSAFTLAEVLITLGIIGVVAGMTIPTLMQNIQDTQYKVAWKKAFSEISQAYTLIKTDNGGDFSGQCTTIDYDDVCLQNLFVQKLNVLKTCTNAVSDGCAPSNSVYANGATNYNPVVGDINRNWPAVVTNSGFIIKFRSDTISNCSTSNSVRSCGWIQVDINGFNKPNVAGKDIFFIGVRKDKILPFGTSGDIIVNSNSDCGSGTTGLGCSAQYLYQ